MYAKPSATMYATVGLETGVAAASPHKLIDMLFDGAEAAVRRALKAHQENDAEARSRAIAHASNIVSEGLRGSLDLKQGGALAEQLDALYHYITGRLMAANIGQEREPLDEALKLLGELHDSWRAIGKADAAGDLRPASFNLAA